MTDGDRSPCGTRAARVARIGGVIAISVVAITLAAAACRKIWGVDFWWQYATGRYIGEHGFPATDAFSYTMPDAPWIELRWLYCQSIYRLEQIVGFEGTTLAKCGAIFVAFGLAAFGSKRRPDNSAAALVILVAVLSAMQRFFLRPELVTFVLFAAFVHVLRRGGKLIWVLPLLQVLWTNAHTVFVLGPLLVGLHVTVCLWEKFRRVEDATRRLRTGAVVLGLTLAACLVNPYGASGALFPFTLYGEIQDSGFKDHIEEFQSPFSFAGFDALLYYKILIGICVAAAALNIGRLDPFWTVLVLAQFWLSALAIRNLPLFALAAIPFVLDNLARSTLWTRIGTRPGVSLVLATLTTLGGTWYTFQLVTNRLYLARGDTNQTGLGLAPHRYPIAAADFLEQHGMTGPCLHTFFESSYLTSRGIKVFMDPRLEVYGEAHFLRYMRLLDGDEDWRAVVHQYGIQTALVDAHSKLADSLTAAADWTLRYFDETAAVFARREAFPSARPIGSRKSFQLAVERLRERLPRPQPPGMVYSLPQPYLRVAGFLLKRRQFEFARPFLEDARTAFEETEEIRRGLALVRDATRR